MVKNDALFSYVAPSNIFAWVLMPLRYCMPLRQFVALNRLVIKITHMPLLFSIYVYERLFLAPYMYEPTDLVENPGRSRQRAISIDPSTRSALFSPNIRVREESVAGFQKDQALEEVFQRTPDITTLRTQRRNERRKTQTAIRHWMDQNDGFADSPQHYSTIDSRAGNEWHRRLSVTRGRDGRRRRQMSEVRSTASDPADMLSNSAYTAAQRFYTDTSPPRPNEVKDNTDADGDDEFVTNDEEEDEDNATNGGERRQAHQDEEAVEDYFTTPAATRFSHSLPSSGRPQATPLSPKQGPSRRSLHNRTLSTNTILYNPPDSSAYPEGSSPSKPPSNPRSRQLSSRHGPVESTPTATTVDHRSPRRSLYHASRPRPIPPGWDHVHTAPSRSAFGIANDTPTRRAQRRLSSFDIGLDTHSDLVGPGGDDTFGGVPSSFVTQMAMATGMVRNAQAARGGDSDRMSRLMLARMKTLEEGFADVVREMKVLQQTSGLPSINHSSADEGRGSGLATIEVAGRSKGRRQIGGGRRPRAAPGRHSDGRPPSRLSMREGTVGLGLDKGKGKVRDDSRPDGDDNDDGPDEGFSRRGSSV